MVLSTSASKRDTCDGKPMCKCADKLPRPKNNVDQGGAVNQATLDYEMLQHILDKLWKYPQFIKSIHPVLFSAQYAIPEETAVVDRAWEQRRVKSLKAVPRSWMASYLLGVYSRDGLSQDILSSLEQVDTDIIPMLFSMDQQYGLGTALPKDMHGDPILANRIFDMRSKALNRRLKPMLAAGGVAVGGVKLHLGGSFSLKFGTGDASDRVVSVAHTASGATAVIPQHTPVTKAFEFENNHLDVESRVCLHPSKYFLHEFFGSDEAFKKLVIVTKKQQPYKDLLETAGKEDGAREDAQKAALAVAQASKSALSTANKQKQKERTDNARSKVVAKQEERQKRRKVTVAKM